MVRGIFSKVIWVGRATVFMVGLSVILAMVFGLASTAFAHKGDRSMFHLGHRNVASAVSTLINNGVGPALNLQVSPGEPPLAVNSSAAVANLNADKVDGQDANAFLGANQKATDADKLDGLDSTEFMRDFAGRLDTHTSVDSTQFKTISVQCPSNGRVVGGYAQIFPNTASEPIPVALQTVGSLGDYSWTATASEMMPYDGNWGISANVLCVKPPPGP